MTLIINSWNKIEKVSNLAKNIKSGAIYSQKEQYWQGSFSPSIFRSADTQIIISQQIYENYINLLNFSKYISPDGTKGVCELPFVWIGRKDFVNGQTIINITDNILYPIILNDNEKSFNPKPDLDYELIKSFLLELQKNEYGTELNNIPTFNLQNCSNDTTSGGLSVSNQIEDLLTNFVQTDGLVIVAGHTHPVMTNASINSASYMPSPKGTNPQSFGLGPRGLNLSNGDLTCWYSCITHDCFDNGATFIAGNICNNGDLNLLIYEGNDPKMARTISLENNPNIRVQTSHYNKQARENFLNYKENSAKLEC